MFRKLFILLKLSWPLVLVGVPFGIIYCLLFRLFPNAIELSDEFRSELFFSAGGGPNTLFGLNSLVLGWVSIVVLEHRSGIVGPFLLVIGFPYWGIAIGGGFALGVFYLGRIPNSTGELIAFCLVCVILSAGVRSFISYLD